MRTTHSPTFDLTWFVRSLEILALVTFVALFFVVPAGTTPWVLIANLVTFYALFLRAITTPDRILSWLPVYLSIEVLFLAFSYLIFYYQYQLFLIGATDLRASVYVSNSFVDGSNEAITLATVGMLAFTIGYRALRATSRKIGSDDDPLISRRNEHRGTPTQYFQIMTIASSAMLLALVSLYLFSGWRSAGEGRYTGTISEGLGVEGVSVAIVMFCMIVGALWVYARATQLPTPPLLVLGLVVAFGWTIRMLILGDRNAFLLFALVIAGGHFTFVRRASRLLLVAALGIWMFVYRSIEVLRFTPNWYRSGNIWDLIQNSAYSRQTSGESSFNVTTIGLRATVETFPDVYEFSHGVLKLIQFSTIIPFSGKFYLPYLDPDYTSSAVMLGDIMLPAGADYEPGTNVISDSYIDFGVLGVMVILFGIGLFAKAIRNYVAHDPSDAHRVIMYLLTMALLAELPRYAVEVPARTLAWALVFSTAIGLVSARIRPRNSESKNKRRSRTPKSVPMSDSQNHDFERVAMTR
jgi:hypothetical protein